MMFLNTDVSGYLDEMWADGIPASSVRTREFNPLPDKWPSFPKGYRDTVVQLYTPSYFKQLMTEKARVVYPNIHHYHLSRLDGELERNLFLSLMRRIGYGRAPLVNAFEFCMTIPSDLVICRKQESGEYEIDFAHVVFPSGWSAPIAYRKPFSYFHTEVTTATRRHVLPEGEAGNKFLEHLTTSGKVYERVGAFNFDTDYILSRTPNKVRTPEQRFTTMENLMVRFERQVIVSLPEYDAFAFFIQPNHVDVRAKPELIFNAIDNADENYYSKK